MRVETVLNASHLRDMPPPCGAVPTQASAKPFPLRQFDRGLSEAGSARPRELEGGR